MYALTDEEVQVYGAFSSYTEDGTWPLSEWGVRRSTRISTLDHSPGLDKQSQGLALHSSSWECYANEERCCE